MASRTRPHRWPMEMAKWAQGTLPNPDKLCATRPTTPHPPARPHGIRPKNWDVHSVPQDVHRQLPDIHSKSSDGAEKDGGVVGRSHQDGGDGHKTSGAILPIPHRPWAKKKGTPLRARKPGTPWYRLPIITLTMMGCLLHELFGRAQLVAHVAEQLLALLEHVQIEQGHLEGAVVANAL